MGVRFVLPVTFGFFDFAPLDVLSEGIPTRVDSCSVVPGIELDYLLPDDWHVIPYVRAGASIASSSVDGWLYGLGIRAERRRALARLGQLRAQRAQRRGRGLPPDVPADEFARLRQGFDLTRGVGWKIRGREVELGLYGIFDVILDPPTAPVAEARKVPLQAEFGIHGQHAARVQDLAVRRAALRLRLPPRRGAVRVASAHRRAVLTVRPRPAGSSRSG